MSMKSTGFTYRALEKKCPSCGDPLLRTGEYLFCEREHGSGVPEWCWDTTALPVATRTAKANRFTIAGETGFWRIPSHADKELSHDGPEGGSVVASIHRYNSKIPTAVTFVRRKPLGISKWKPRGPNKSFMGTMNAPATDSY